MSSGLRLVVLLVLALGTAACGSLGAKRWAQFHADGPSQGFLAVRSDFATRPGWSRQVGPVFHSSASLGPDGTIFVGSSKGTLSAITPDGAFKCRVDFPGSAILASPAADGQGSVYVVTIRQTEGRFTSTLHGVDSNCAVQWSFTFPGASVDFPSRTTASAKTWTLGGNVYIFVPVQLSKPCEFDCNDPEDGLNELFVFNQSGRLITRETVGGCLRVTGGGFGGDDDGPPAGSLERVWDAITTTGLVVGQPPGTPLWEQVGWLDPTVAIADFANVAQPGHPLVVVANYCLGLRLTAFRWDPIDLNRGSLVRLWTHEDQSGRLFHSSPAVFPNGLVVLGRVDGLVQAFDAATGARLWHYDADDAVMATPASFGRQIYVASLTHLHVLEPDGALVDTARLFGGQTIASPAVTANLVYISTTIGLLTFSFDLASVALDIRAPGGMSSPAVGSDGTIYAVKETGDGRSLLRAYPR